MGVSTDAILFYGIQYDDGESIISDENNEEYENRLKDDWEDVVTEKLGIVDTSGLFDAKGEYAVSEGEERRKREAKWNEYIDRKHGALEKLKAEIGVHCSYDYPMYYLASKKSMRIANRGNPIELGGDVTAMIEWDAEIKEFCDKFGLKFKKPQWILCSLWG